MTDQQKALWETSSPRRSTVPCLPDPRFVRVCTSRMAYDAIRLVVSATDRTGSHGEETHPAPSCSRLFRGSPGCLAPAGSVCCSCSKSVTGSPSRDKTRWRRCSTRPGSSAIEPAMITWFCSIWAFCSSARAIWPGPVRSTGVRFTWIPVSCSRASIWAWSRPPGTERCGHCAVAVDRDSRERRAGRATPAIAAGIQ